MHQIGDIEAAIAEFRERLPGWWFTLGDCSVSADASCGPDRNYCDKSILVAFDDGFHVDDESDYATLAGSLRAVTDKAVRACNRRSGKRLHDLRFITSAIRRLMRPA